MATNNLLSVKVPYAAKLNYTLFAEGASIDRPVIDKDEQFITFFYSPKSVAVLFYTFSEFRRVYVVTQYTGYGEKTFLPGIDIALSIIFFARGKKFDSMKRAIFLLKEKYGYGIFLERPLFWQKLAGLCHRNTGRHIIFLFYENWRNGKWNSLQA